jgi:regulator of protease activity HflC (stomatin/prohibitin superfamily)
MTGFLVLMILLVLFVAVFLFYGLKIVRQAEAIVIERLGSYLRTLKSGVNIIVPILDNPRDIQWVYHQEGSDRMGVQRKMRTARIDLRENIFDFPRQNVITRDNVVIEINAMLYFQVIDPKKAVYEIVDLPAAIEKLTQTTLRNVIGELDLDETLTSRDTINSKLRVILDEATDKWGVKINRVELQDIIPPEDIKQAMEKQMRAERDRRAAILEAEGKKQAAILEAEGERQSEINQAEGEKQSAILVAEGQAQARVKVAEAEAEAIRRIREAFADAETDASQYLIAINYLATLKEMTSGQNNKVVYLPYEASGILSSVGGIKELLDKTKLG